MAELSDHLRLLSDDTRLRILHLLASEPLTVAELQDILDLGQSSISGHLAKLTQAGLVHAVAEGAARRYRPRADVSADLTTLWLTVRQLSDADPRHARDRERCRTVLERRGSDWVDRVAGSLHREYAPGRTWDSLCHGLLAFARFGRCVDVGAGDGSLIELIAPRATTLDSIDPSAVMVAAGKARTNTLNFRNVRWHQARAEALPMPDGVADSVLFLQSLQYVEQPAKALAEAIRVLAPGGRLLVLTLLKHEHAEAERYGHRQRGFSSADLQRWCKGLTQIQCETLPPEQRPPHFQTLLLSAVR